jgi:hypothetical protein
MNPNLLTEKYRRRLANEIVENTSSLKPLLSWLTRYSGGKDVRVRFAGRWEDNGCVALRNRGGIRSTINRIGARRFQFEIRGGYRNPKLTLTKKVFYP